MLNSAPDLEETAPTPSGQRVDKIERYGWKLQDSPGTYRMIPKSKLKVPEEYQRDFVRKKIYSIAREWSWAACGALIVVDRGRDGYFVVDGQHRKLAADQRADIKMLPCLIFEMENVKQEAGAFLSVNTNRKPLTIRQRFKAMVVAEDPVAAKVSEYLSYAGREVGYTTGNHVNCISSITQCVREDEEAFANVWPLIVQLSEGKPIHKVIVEGLFWLEKNRGEESLASKYWSKRVLSIGYDELITAIRKFRELHGKGGAKMSGQGILTALHKGARRRFIEVSV